MVASVKNCVVTESECELTVRSRSHSRGEGIGGKQEVTSGLKKLTDKTCWMRGRERNLIALLSRMSIWEANHKLNLMGG
jgi:hypothetical protein